MGVSNLTFDGSPERCWALLSDSAGYGYVQWGELSEHAAGPRWPEVGAEVTLSRQVLRLGEFDVRDRVVAVDDGRRLVVSHRIGRHDIGRSEFTLTSVSAQATNVEIDQTWSVSLPGMRIPVILPKPAAVSRRLDGMLFSQRELV